MLGKGEMMAQPPHMVNRHITGTILLLLLAPLILGIIFLPWNPFLASVLIATWVWDVVFIFYSVFFLHGKTIPEDTDSTTFEVDIHALSLGDIGEHSGIERTTLLVISVLTAVWITIHSLMSIILVLTFIGISYINEMIFPIEDKQGNVVRFDDLRIKVLMILDFAFLPVIVASGYFSRDSRFMWFLIGIWFIAIFTHFNMIRRERRPSKGNKKVKARGVGI